MNRSKYLLKNMGILTVSNFASKILVFLLVPLYTSVLTTAEYGSYDLAVSTATLLYPILTLNIVDAVMRFAMDKEYSKEKIAVAGMRYVSASVFIFAIVMLIIAKFDLWPDVNGIEGFIFLYYFSYVYNQFLVQFSKGLERVRDMGMAGIVSTLVMVLGNIIFLLVFKWGLSGFFIANILAQGISAIYLMIRIRLWNYLKDLKNDYALTKEMLVYCIPLMASAIGWWVNSAADKYVVVFMLGVAANGILSVSYKIPQIINVVQSIFIQAYKVFINLVNNNVYTDQQYLEAIQKINELHPYGFCIVDTFGTMRLSELSHRYYLVENNIHPDMTIGLHLHENLGLAYSLAQHLTEIASPKRDIVIDGSLLGMGRVPGNLCIEQIMDYMNSQYGTNYALEPVYDAIDDYIAPIKAVNPWGFSIPYALSAKYNLHRTYAEYLAGKNRLKTKDIQRILSQIPQSEAETYNESYVEKLYLDYMNVSYDDRNDIAQLKTDLVGKDVMVIAPGASIKSASQKIKDAISDNTIIISVNFNPETVATSDIVFLTNTKRYDMIKHRSTSNKLMITSNLIRDVENRDYTIAYNEISHFGDEYCDDSTLMLLSLLQKCGVKEVKLCGFDGSKSGDRLTFCDGLLDRNAQKNDSKKIQAILDSALSGIKKTFITESVYR